MLRYKEIFLGNQCDNKCLYCSYRYKDLSQPDTQTVISSINDNSSPRDDGIAFYGGEPATRKDLPDIIQEAKGKGYRRIKLITNGRAFSDMQFLRQIMYAGCYLFELKIWGSHPDLHDHLTQTKGSFTETMKGLENLSGFQEEKFVCVRIPVCRENYRDVENTVSLVLGYGINRIILSFQDYALAFRQAMPHLRNAINISVFNRIWILTEGLPFCLMDGMEHHISEIYSGWKTIYERTFAHHNFCGECVYSDLCPGMEERHLKQFGDMEVTHLTSRKYLEAMKALYA